MLDRKLFEENGVLLEQGLKKRGLDSGEVLKKIRSRLELRRGIVQRGESLKAERNKISQEVGLLKSKSKQDPTLSTQADQKMQQARALGDEIKKLDEELLSCEQELEYELLRVPNCPIESVPEGKDAQANVQIKIWGKPKNFDFSPKDHVTLGEELGILDFERAVKMSGSRFVIYSGAGATLERALIQFMLDVHIREHGYQEVIPPFLVSRDTMMGTGQLPKFEEDLFKTTGVDRELFLIPTSEVSLTNIPRQEILEPGVLPLYFTAYSPCFRSEAGSYGKDVRGLIRLHQFQKVELVKLCSEETSESEHEKMTKDAGRILELLGLPYRVMLLCGGDMGFSSAKTYDLEVWLPTQGGHYREISSCSNCTDFQARRAQIRYRAVAGDKPRFVHTLNGSGLAVGRTVVAVLENFQTKEGRIEIPKVLHRYVEGAPGFEVVGKGEDKVVYLVGKTSRLKGAR